ncbi:Gx transporter family protein [Clostridium gasigenes]|uniref:Gx transporter family protein n=1 Tax=Clostridium gasigenes TaxID=94869 RepID=UPI00209B9313|nr:Gx transporter family protein [Clostridium gasigenes]
MVYIALLVAQALVLHIFERMIPVPFITPGAKLGLANLITVVALYTLEDKKDAFLVIFLRLTLGTMFGGNLSSFMYSAMGGILSFLGMVFIKETFKDKVSIIGVSSVGAIFHNVGQLIVASLIVKNIGVMLYLPVLSTIGIGTGIFIGITANYLVKHLSKLSIFR